MLSVFSLFSRHDSPRHRTFLSPLGPTLRTMGLPDITRESVLAAVAECDDLGREAFLLRYDFAPARAYDLLHDGRRYEIALTMVATSYIFRTQ